MPADPTRRRALRILVAAAAASVAPRSASSQTEWRGTALGADVSISFADAEGAATQAAVAEILLEIERLEAVFSLQRGDSELSRLNAASRLESPSPDLLNVLSIARMAHAATLGRFDPTVQPLWRFFVDWYARDRGRARPGDEDLAAARALVGFGRIRASAAAIELPVGAALTLNGIAQGYITDRASALLRRAGFRRVLVDLGETRALDGRADGDAWRVGLPDGRRVALQDGALATSAGAATRFADNGDHHIFDPVDGRPARRWDWLAVAHKSAAVADALSTGLYCLAPEAAIKAAGAVSGVRLWGYSVSGAQVEA